MGESIFKVDIDTSHDDAENNQKHQKKQDQFFEEFFHGFIVTNFLFKLNFSTIGMFLYLWMIVFLNRKFLTAKEAKVSVFDHGFLYGDGVYETLRTYGGKVWQIDEHLKRLEQSARFTALQLVWSRNQLRKWVEKLLDLNGFSESRIRITLTRGSNDFDFNSCGKPTLLITVQPLKPEPKKIYNKGVDVISVRLQRVLPEVKSISLFPFILARQKMKEVAAYEAFFVNEKGFVTEGTVTNFFIVRKGIVMTPKHDILLGTTRGFLLELMRKMDLQVRVTDLKLKDLFQAEEIFITNAPKGIVPVRQFDGTIVGDGKPGAVTRQLMKAFKQETGIVN